MKKETHKHNVLQAMILMLFMLIGVAIVVDSTLENRINDLKEEIEQIKNSRLICEKQAEGWGVRQELDCDSVLIAGSCVEDFHNWKKENCKDNCVPEEKEEYTAPKNSQMRIGCSTTTYFYEDGRMEQIDCSGNTRWETDEEGYMTLGSRDALEVEDE